MTRPPIVAALSARKSMAKMKCSFCGKNQDEVQQLIAGPKVFICDECVELCVGIVLEGHPERIEKFEQLLRKLEDQKGPLPNSKGASGV
jgi:hypothetical protein